MATSPSRTRGEYAKSAARRHDIVLAAVEVFSAAGYRTGSLRDVADRAGLSHAGVLHHFPTKTDLLQAVLAWRDEEQRRRAGNPRTGAGALRAWLDAVRFNRTTPDLVELYVTLQAEATSPDHPAHEYFVRRSAETAALLTTAFELVAAEGGLRPGVEPAGAARALLAVTEGLQVQWLLDRDAVDMAAEVRHALRALVTVDL